MKPAPETIRIETDRGVGIGAKIEAAFAGDRCMIHDGALYTIEELTFSTYREDGVDRPTVIATARRRHGRPLELPPETKP